MRQLPVDHAAHHGCHRPHRSAQPAPDAARHRADLVHGDIAGFLFDLLSDIEAIVWEADADTLAVEFVNDRILDLLAYEPMDVIAVPRFWTETIVHSDDRDLSWPRRPRWPSGESRA